MGNPFAKTCKTLVRTCPNPTLAQPQASHDQPIRHNLKNGYFFGTKIWHTDTKSGGATLTCGLWIVDYGFWIIGCGLRIVDCGLWIVDYGLWIMD